MTEYCDIYNNVENITTNCQINLLGTSITTPCIPLCITALQYAVSHCEFIYGQSHLLEKIINLLKSCESPTIKEKIIQFLYK